MMSGIVVEVFLEIVGGRRRMLAGGESCFFSGQARGTMFVIDRHMICEMSSKAFFVASPTCRVGKDATGWVKSVIMSWAV